MPRKKKDNREEILRNAVGSGGTSSPALDAMHSEKFVEGSNVQAAEIAAAVIKTFGGQMEALTAKFMERMDKMDKAAEKWERDRQAFIDDMKAQAEALRVYGDEKDKLVANATDDIQKKIAAVRASIPLDRKAFEYALSQEPKEEIVSPGISMMVMEGGMPVAKLYAEEIRVRHLRFVLYPGKPTMLPKSIAALWRDRRKSQEETIERQLAMSKNLEVSELDAQQKKIDAKYGSSTSHLDEDPSQVYQGDK